MSCKPFAVAVLLVSFVCTLAGAAHAATIIKPTGVTTASELYPVTQIIDGSGLSSDLLTGDALPMSYPTHDGSAVWAVHPNAPAPTVTFDLGNVYDLDGFHVWNFNEPGFTTVGFRNVGISFSTTSAVAGYGPVTVFSGASQFAQANASPLYTGETKLFGDVETARWVRFEALTNWGQPTYLGGLSEVRFIGELYVAPLPAPEPTSLIILGLGTIGLAHGTRRRNRR